MLPAVSAITEKNGASLQSSLFPLLLLRTANRHSISNGWLTLTRPYLYIFDCADKFATWQLCGWTRIHRTKCTRRKNQRHSYQNVFHFNPPCFLHPDEQKV